MTKNNIGRREFLAAVGASMTVGVVDSDAGSCRRRGPPGAVPLCTALPAPHLPLRPPKLRVRPNVLSLNERQLDALKRGVAAMKRLPKSDPRSWSFQAAIHGTDSHTTNPLFNQCQHGTLQFLTWHRAYLHFFERILRWAAGDPTLNLPYWDWTARPTLPKAFRQPASPTNPLYEAKRAFNDGSALPRQVVSDDLRTALNFVAFQRAGQTGFSPSLEDSPHGNVHTIVGGPGGTMSRIQTAAQDPIFWLHHGNIDRLWDRWLRLRGGRADPPDSSFLNQKYAFANESG